MAELALLVVAGFILQNVVAELILQNVVAEFTLLVVAELALLCKRSFYAKVVGYR